MIGFGQISIFNKVTSFFSEKFFETPLISYDDVGQEAFNIINNLHDLTYEEYLNKFLTREKFQNIIATIDSNEYINFKKDPQKVWDRGFRHGYEYFFSMKDRLIKFKVFKGEINYLPSTLPQNYTKSKFKCVNDNLQLFKGEIKIKIIMDRVSTTDIYFIKSENQFFLIGFGEEFLKSGSKKL